MGEVDPGEEVLEEVPLRLDAEPLAQLPALAHGRLVVLLRQACHLYLGGGGKKEKTRESYTRFGTNDGKTDEKLANTKRFPSS